jgi:hypothetical protein
MDQKKWLLLLFFKEFAFSAAEFLGLLWSNLTADLGLGNLDTAVEGAFFASNGISAPEAEDVEVPTDLVLEAVAVGAVAASVSLLTTRIRAQFSDFKRSFSNLSLWSC